MIGIRTGEHKGYSRIVFDWLSKVPYQVRRTDTATAITFQRPGRVNLAPINARPPVNLRTIESNLEEGKLTVTLTMPEGARVRHFYSGPKLVVDIMTPASALASASASAPTETEISQPAKAIPTAPPAKTEAPARLEKVAGGGPAPLLPESAPVPQPARGEAAKAAGGPIALTPPKGEPGKQGQTVPRQAGGVTAAVEQPAGGQAPGSNMVSLGPSMPNLGPEPLEKALEAAVPAGLALPPGLDSVVTLRFDWNEPVAAAVFRRAGYLWAVFDKAKEMDLDSLRTAGGNVIRTIERVPAKRATALRLTTVSGINPSIRRDGLSWILEFRKQPLAPVTTIEANPEPNSPVGARLFFSVPEPGNVIAIRDPEVGDNLVVVPVIPLGHGVTWNYRYPQARILLSGQGVVIQPRIDDLRIKPLRQGVEITSGGGLKISPVTEQLLAKIKLGPTKPLSRVFDLDQWRRGGLAAFNANKYEFQNAIAVAKGKDREKARLDLAHLYFANNMAAEALGVLQLVGEDRPEIVNEPDFKALRGASNVLMGRLDEAKEDLYQPVLDNIDEAIFWRAILRAKDNDLAGAAPDLKRTSGITFPYPNNLKIPLAAIAADAAVETGDIRQATRFLDVLNVIGPSPAQKSELNYITGRLRELAGDFDEAIGLWEEVQRGTHRPSRAKAARARAELLFKLNRITAAEAIEELEKLRFSWRGDIFEFGLLRRLGELYVTDGKYREGLRTLKQAAIHFRDNEKAIEVTQDMVDIFSRLYLDDEADQMPPVAAIALYDDFKELTPAGPKGDEMIRKLADRLVAVDLLDRAAQLLDNQVKFRLKGTERARVGARLALVYILDRKFDKAIETLETSNGKGLPEALASQRRHLMARALVDMNRGKEVLPLLEADASADADLLRAEIYWQRRDWTEVSRYLTRLIRGEGQTPPQTLDDRQARHVLDLAVALTLSGNELALARLREGYGSAMAKGPFKDAFQLIASPQTQGLINYRSIADKVSEVENFQVFLSSYRERLRDSSLSAIN